jgi:hypothetical protein
LVILEDFQREKKKKNSKMACKLGYSMTLAFKKQQHAAS